jgi:hypothetical protein
MDDPTTTATLDHAEEEILTSTLSDEALEAAAGRGGSFDPTGACWGLPASSGGWACCC